MVSSLAEWDKEMQDKERGPKIIAYAKKSANEDILKFLSLMKGKKFDKNSYNLFIKPGAKYEMNIDGDLREKFSEDALKDAPWDKVIKEVLKMYTDNVSKKVK